MDLPAPSLFEHLFLEQPWTLILALLVLAVVMVVTARRRMKQTGLLLAAAVLVLAALGVYLTSWMVVTPREQVMASTRKLVQATAPLRKNILLELLDPQVLVVDARGRTLVPPGEAVDTLSRNIDHWALDSQSVFDLQAAPDGENAAATSFGLRTWMKQGSLVKSRWYLTWRRDDAQSPWRVSRIQWVALNDNPADTNFINRIVR